MVWDFFILFEIFLYTQRFAPETTIIIHTNPFQTQPPRSSLQNGATLVTALALSLERRGALAHRAGARKFVFDPDPNRSYPCSDLYKLDPANPSKSIQVGQPLLDTNGKPLYWTMRTIESFGRCEGQSSYRCSWTTPASKAAQGVCPDLKYMMLPFDNIQACSPTFSVSSRTPWAREFIK